MCTQIWHGFKINPYYVQVIVQLDLGRFPLINILRIETPEKWNTSQTVNCISTAWTAVKILVTGGRSSTDFLMNSVNFLHQSGFRLSSGMIRDDTLPSKKTWRLGGKVTKFVHLFTRVDQIVALAIKALQKLITFSSIYFYIFCSHIISLHSSLKQMYCGNFWN